MLHEIEAAMSTKKSSRNPDTPKRTVRRPESGMIIKGPHTTLRGTHVWRVGSGENAQTIVTSATSVSSLDHTVTHHHAALKRLAER
jgi:hypothetical protein